MKRHVRKKFSDWERRMIACQQAYRCALCAKLLPFAWELDHINPLFNGGDNERQNMQILCGCCHGAKSILERASGGSVQPIQSSLLADGDIDMGWAKCPERARGRDRELKCQDCGKVVSPYFDHECGAESQGEVIVDSGAKHALHE
jgi:phage FluMu protein Com